MSQTIPGWLMFGTMLSYIALAIAYGSELFSIDFSNGFSWYALLGVADSLVELISFGGANSPLPIELQVLGIVAIGLPWLFFLSKWVVDVVPGLSVAAAVPLLALGGLVGISGDVDAAHGPYASVEPTGVVWDEGGTLRVCALETPTSSFNITDPDGGFELRVGDSDHCVSFQTPLQGLWNVTWATAGGARYVLLDVADGGLPWQFYVEMSIMFGLVLLGAFMGWIWVACFTAVPLIGQFVPTISFGFEFAIIMALAGVLLELAANGFRKVRSE